MSDKMNPENFQSLCRDVKEIKGALIGSDTFGQKGLVQRMSDVEDEIVQNRKQIYQNGGDIRHLSSDVKNIKKTSAGLGAGGGLSIAALIEFFRGLF